MTRFDCITTFRQREGMALPSDVIYEFSVTSAPCRLRGCKNTPAVIDVVKPTLSQALSVSLSIGLVCMCSFVLFIRDTLYIVSLRFCVFCLFVVLVKLSVYLPNDWQERLL